MISAQTIAVYKEHYCGQQPASHVYTLCWDIAPCLDYSEVGLGIFIYDHNGQFAVAMTRFFGLFLDMNHTSIRGLLKVLHFGLEMWFRSIGLVVHSTSCY
jgi:hypothetical protein